MNDPDLLDWAWFLSNFIAGIGYLMIPYEIGHWTKGAVRGSGFVVLANMFQIIFFFCGLHHLAMLGTFGHHPTPGYLIAVDGVMGFVTLVGAYVMHRHRKMITAAFHSMLAHWEEWTPRG